MILSIPMCLLSAIYLSEYAHRHFRELVRLVIDILAGIPSVIYGLCGVIVVVPFVHHLGGFSVAPQRDIVSFPEASYWPLWLPP